MYCSGGCVQLGKDSHLTKRRFKGALIVPRLDAQGEACALANDVDFAHPTRIRKQAQLFNRQFFNQLEHHKTYFSLRHFTQFVVYIKLILCRVGLR
jgi:hypothetical protein